VICPAWSGKKGKKSPVIAKEEKNPEEKEKKEHTLLNERGGVNVSKAFG